jgi:NAD(P)-dependent dehydrogenase (short-subunit alcohol dehydrogenase family)
MDVTDAGQFAAAARRVTDIDLLVNNAGAFEPTEQFYDSPKAVERQMAALVAP